MLTTQSSSQPEYRLLPVDQLVPNAYNPNRMSPGHVETLKRTIEKDGFVGVILVNRAKEGYEIIDGERRWRAAHELQMPTVPCLVVQIPTDQAKSLTIKINQIHGRWQPDLLTVLIGMTLSLGN